MKKIIFPAIIIFLAGSLFFAHTYSEWRHFSPAIRVLTPAADETPGAVPLPRRRDGVRIYSNPFFPSLPEEEAPRTSQLILRGTVIGTESLAVVELKDRPGETRIVRVNESVAGEKILSINEGWITVQLSGGETVLLTVEEAP